MQREAAAGGEAEQDEFCVRMPGANRGDKIGHIVVKLSGIVDITAHAGLAVAANIGRVNRDALGAQRLRQRMQAGARRRRAVDCDKDTRGIGDGGFSRQTRNAIGGAVTRGNGLNSGRSRKSTVLNGSATEASGGFGVLVPNTIMRPKQRRPPPADRTR